MVVTEVMVWVVLVVSMVWGMEKWWLLIGPIHQAPNLQISLGNPVSVSSLHMRYGSKISTPIKMYD